MTARAWKWTLFVAWALFVLAVAVFAWRDNPQIAVEPAGTRLMVNGEPLVTTLPEAAGAPISVTEGFATAPIQGGHDFATAGESVVRFEVGAVEPPVLMVSFDGFVNICDPTQSLEWSEKLVGVEINPSRLRDDFELKIGAGTMRLLVNGKKYLLAVSSDRVELREKP